MHKPTFEHVNYSLDISVAGHDFTVDCSSDTGDYLKQLSSELQNIASAISEGSKTKEDAIAFGINSIDHLLGAGAANKIFYDVPATISRICDVCVFIANSVAQFNKEKYTVMPNRAQRRAADKK